MISAVYGGGQLAMFVGWLVVLVLSECVTMSLGELASRYPTAAGPHFWTFRLASPQYKKLLSFVTGWTWLIGNWTITLAVNFGFASLIAACVALYYPDFVMSAWQLLLIFYAVCLGTFSVVAFCNHLLPFIDTICAGFTLVSVVSIFVSLLVKADDGRNSAAVTFGQYDATLSGWNGFSFFIGLVPAAYVFAPIGMLASMAEECANPTVTVPRAMCLCIPTGGIVGLLFILPICATMPAALDDILGAPVGQALPYIYGRVMGTPGGGLALTTLVLVIALFCSISITVAASRCTWAFARDSALPLSGVWSQVNKRFGSPLNALALCTVIEMLLGLISLGSTSAFSAFVSCGVIAIAVSYAVPLALSMYHGRSEVRNAAWNLDGWGRWFGWAVNTITMAWCVFQVVIFSVPIAIPVTAISMNYAIVVYVGFLVLCLVWYIVYARKGKTFASFCLFLFFFHTY